jgi:hypothetical protein
MLALFIVIPVLFKMLYDYEPSNAKMARLKSGKPRTDNKVALIITVIVVVVMSIVKIL